MRILAVADTELGWLTGVEARSQVGEVDAVVSCGDLPAAYLEHIETLFNVPLLYVWGNHDTAYRAHAPEGCQSLEGRIVEVGSLRFMGLGGSVRYNNRVFGFTERDMYWRMLKLALRAKATGGIDVLVTHAPVRGMGDLDDMAHRGFAAFDTCLTMLRPALMLYGHVHPEYGRIERERVHPAGTRVLNCCGYRIIDLPDPVR